jgi:hypothetical protein
VSAAVAEATQIALHGQFSTAVAELLDFAEQLGGVAFAIVPAPVQVLGVGVDQVCPLLGLGSDILGGAGLGELAHGGLVQAELAADRRLGHPPGEQLVHGGVMLTQPSDDPLLRQGLHDRRDLDHRGRFGS